MAARSYNLTIGATPRRLSDVYPTAGGGVPAPGDAPAAADIPYRQIILQAETADIEIGVDPAVLTTSVYGAKLVASTSAPLTLGPFESGPIKLSDFYAISTSATLHILGIPY